MQMARVDLGPLLPGARPAHVLLANTGDAPVPRLTLLELVAAVAEVADSDDEVVATVEHLLASGRVRLVGQFRNRDLDPDES